MQTMLLKGVDPNTDPNNILAELRQAQSDDVTFVGVKPFIAAVKMKEE